MGDVFFDLSVEVRDLSAPLSVERIASVPDPLTFLREYASFPFHRLSVSYFVYVWPRENRFSPAAQHR
jgi:hypothetical protein